MHPVLARAHRPTAPADVLSSRPAQRRGRRRRLPLVVLPILLAAFAALLLSYIPPPTQATAGKGPGQPAFPATPLDPITSASKRTAFIQDVLDKEPGQNICSPTGQIQDACCDFETVEQLNTKLFGQLSDLVRSRYFRYYKVDLFRDCPFWVENGLCMNRACGVETADESEVPEMWRGEALSGVKTASEEEVFGGRSPVCHYKDQDFCEIEDESNQESVYVDLIANPERFTGYAGASANRVWKSIYEENCFGAVPFLAPARSSDSGGSGFIDRRLLSNAGAGAGAKTSSESGKADLGSSLAPGAGGLHGLLASLEAPRDTQDEEVCLEKRVYYRIISGLHASISIHICHEYLNQTTGEWTPNLECFLTRIAEHPERLENVYFNYGLLVRALARAGEYIEHFDLKAGDEIQDRETKEKLEALVATAKDCPTTFDEKSMFVGENASILKEQFKTHFRNVSTIMDCVGCDKCRLWGKLQVSGLGTALKILFSYEEAEFDPKVNPTLLQRSELVALINTLHRFSESLHAVDAFRHLYQDALAEIDAAERADQAAVAAAAEEEKRPLAGSDSSLGRANVSNAQGRLARAVAADDDQGGGDDAADGDGKEGRVRRRCACNATSSLSSSLSSRLSSLLHLGGGNGNHGPLSLLEHYSPSSLLSSLLDTCSFSSLDACMRKGAQRGAEIWQALLDRTRSASGRDGGAWTGSTVRTPRRGEGEL